jgi:hypothetical protein
MHNDLARIAKAKGIYRTLSLMAILSKPAATENGRDKHESAEQVSAVDIGVKVSGIPDKGMIRCR